MKNKKIFMYIIIILLILFILWIGIILVKNNNTDTNEEFIPEQEITEEQLRSTNIILYFSNLNTGELETEIRKIDSKKLLENPEKQLITYLIDGPKNGNLVRLIPENTKLISAEIEKEILIINFSEDFIENQNLGKEQEEKIIKSILKTVTQLNEINGIKILINGEENKKFPDNELNFENIFFNN